MSPKLELPVEQISGRSSNQPWLNGITVTRQDVRSVHIGNPSPSLTICSGGLCSGLLDCKSQIDSDVGYRLETELM